MLFVGSRNWQATQLSLDCDGRICVREDEVSALEREHCQTSWRAAGVVTEEWPGAVVGVVEEVGREDRGIRKGRQSL